MYSEWQAFFGAVIGATGVLLGLLFVAVSYSISKIIVSEKMSRVVRQPFLLLITILIGSLWFLVPGQSMRWLGLEVALTGVTAWSFMIGNDMKLYKEALPAQRQRYLSNVLFNSTPMTLMIVSGALLFFQNTVGVFLMIPTIVIGFIQVSMVSWVFLFEINRRPQDGQVKGPG